MAKRTIKELYHNLQLDPDKVAHDQIIHFFRQAIQKHELAPGERVPTLRDLATLWNSNYFTIQRATETLVSEGLLFKRKRLGIFVSEEKKALTHVCLYLSNRQHQYDEYAFYDVLQEELNNQLLMQGIHAIILRDNRPMSEHTKAPPLLEEAIQESSIQGVIGVLLHIPDIKWLTSLPVPVSCIGGDQAMSVSHDNIDMLKKGITHLARCGRKKIALITHYTRLNPETRQPEYPQAYRVILDTLKQYGLKLNKSWARSGNDSYKRMVKFGYDQMNALWKLSSRPDGLLVLPDEVSRGVIMAALELGIKVPEELKIISHRNNEIKYFCPLKMDYLNISVTETATALIQQLHHQVNGQIPQPIIIKPKLQTYN